MSRWFGDLDLCAYALGKRMPGEPTLSEVFASDRDLRIKFRSLPMDPWSLFPLYRCHKIVTAFKIGALKAGMAFPESGDVGIVLPKGFTKKHKPAVGGYLVRYEDGYTSYSPAEAFEAGYSRVPDPVMATGKAGLVLEDLSQLASTAG